MDWPWVAKFVGFIQHLPGVCFPTQQDWVNHKHHNHSINQSINQLINQPNNQSAGFRRFRRHPRRCHLDPKAASFARVSQCYSRNIRQNSTVSHSPDGESNQPKDVTTPRNVTPVIYVISFISSSTPRQEKKIGARLCILLVHGSKRTSRHQSIERKRKRKRNQK